MGASFLRHRSRDHRDAGATSADEHGAGAPLRSACFAPHSALYFRPDGLVQACCTTGYAVGTVCGPSRQTLREIWEGAALADQRSALERDNFGLGCQECEFAIATGGRETATAYHFDRYGPGAPHDGPKLIDFALSNRCNLQCVMCNGGLSSAIRAQREHLPPLPAAYDEQFFAELDEFLPGLDRAQFKGGEPFLARESRRVWDSMIRQGCQPEVSVTTNGTIFNEHVERYVSELRMHPNISVDAMDPALLAAIRVGVDPEVLWTNIDRFQELAEAGGQGMTLSFCLMASNWRELLPFLREVDRRGINGNVIAVNQPPEHDLHRLPAPELLDVLQHLEELDPSWTGAVAQREWSIVFDRLRSQLEQPVELQVQAPPTPTRMIGLAARAELEAEARAEHGVGPLKLRFRDGRVADVHSVAWAAWLRPESWTQVPAYDLPGHIGRSLDVGVDMGPPTAHGPGIERRTMTITADSQQDRRFAIYNFCDETDGCDCGWVLPANG